MNRVVESTNVQRSPLNFQGAGDLVVGLEGYRRGADKCRARKAATVGSAKKDRSGLDVVAARVGVGSRQGKGAGSRFHNPARSGQC